MSSDLFGSLPIVAYKSCQWKALLQRALQLLCNLLLQELPSAALQRDLSRSVTYDSKHINSPTTPLLTSSCTWFSFCALQYYSLDVTFFKSSLDSHLLDLLWNKYWVNTLSASPLISNREFAAGQIADVAEKLEQVRRVGGPGLLLGS
jgi:hypothetical protein